MYNNQVFDLSDSWYNVTNNTVIAIMIEQDAGDLVYFDCNNGIVYKLKNKVPEMFMSLKPVGEEIEIGFRERPNEKLSLKNDFEAIIIK
jgi:hypothetical protein